MARRAWGATAGRCSRARPSRARSPPTRWAARRRSPPTSARAGSGRLLEAMVDDRYPAVRHLAWRSLRRLTAPGAAPGAGLAADYDPSADAAARLRVVTRRAARAGTRRRRRSIGARWPLARDADLEIGE